MKKQSLFLIAAILILSIFILSCKDQVGYEEVSVSGGKIETHSPKHTAPSVVHADAAATYVQVAWPVINNTVEYRLYIKDL